MTFRFSTTVFSLIVMLAALSGCAKYKPQSLAFLGGNVQEQEDIELATKPLTDLECKTYFDRKMVSKGYQPIQICIKNKTDQSFVLNSHDIELPLESASKVSKKLHKNTMARVMSWGAAGLVAWPFLIPAVVDGVKSAEANKNLDEDFDRRIIGPHEQIMVGPHTSVNKVIIVATENYRSDFSVGLIGKKDGKKLEFNM